MFNRGVSGSDSVINNIKEIPIHQIDDIDHNPRYKKDNDVYNEKYDDLKEGIFSTKGKYITLEVTENEQVPGHYKIFKGGSTRLRVIRELYEAQALSNSQTNDFETVKCIVYPRVEESVRLVMTATENITRGDLCYGEKAQAMQYILAAFRMERGYDDSRDIVRGEFIEYADSIGAKSLVRDRFEYRLLQGCYEHFVSANVLNKKIIDGRANREFVRGVYSERIKFIEYCQEHGIETGEIDWNQLCEKIDDKNLTLTDIKKQISEYKARGKVARDLEEKITAEEVEKRLGKDPKTNAMLIVREIIDTGTYRSSRRKTTKLKSMGIENDLSGFVDLLRMIPKKEQREIMKQVYKNRSAEEAVT